MNGRRLLLLLPFSTAIWHRRHGAHACSCDVRFYQQSGFGNKACSKPGIDFGCYPDEDTMWIRPPCGSVFRCNVDDRDSGQTRTNRAARLCAVAAAGTNRRPASRASTVHAATVPAAAPTALRRRSGRRSTFTSAIQRARAASVPPSIRWAASAAPSEDCRSLQTQIPLSAAAAISRDQTARSASRRSGSRRGRARAKRSATRSRAVASSATASAPTCACCARRASPRFCSATTRLRASSAWRWTHRSSTRAG